MCVFVAAPVLSVDSVMAVLEKHQKEWKEVGISLSLPFPLMLDILEKDISSDEDKLRSVVRYWLLRDPKTSWKRLICPTWAPRSPRPASASPTRAPRSPWLLGLHDWHQPGPHHGLLSVSMASPHSQSRARNGQHQIDERAGATTSASSQLATFVLPR